jgi:hypothetical protein
VSSLAPDVTPGADVDDVGKNESQSKGHRSHVDIVINLVYAFAANLYEEISAGSTAGVGEQQNP